mmetsp:Transcript_42960/g.59637  ORF Transcript_42960/g.59637 Transcript_42960/m.59637 type:complete len:90 (-) Transcript_42960:22-291(-)
MNYQQNFATTFTTATPKTNAPSSDAEGGVFVCHHEDCQKQFKHRSSLNRHLTTHSTTKPFSCPYGNCKKSFSRVDSLNAHIKIHSQDFS